MRKSKGPPRLAEALAWFRLRLLRGGLGLARVGLGKFTSETLHAARRIDQLLLAGKERVAGSADFDDDVALVRGAGLKVIAAGALDGDGVVLRVNSFFGHGSLYPLADVVLIGACRVAVRLRTVWSRHIECLSRLPCRPLLGSCGRFVWFILLIRPSHLDSHRGISIQVLPY